MTIKLSDIELELLTGADVPPGRLAELRLVLSAKYAEASNHLEQVLLAKPSIWNELRRNHKSDTATEREWEASEYGLSELKWKMTLKKIEKMMTAIKTMIDVRTTEARNLY